jgi:hypothetical protein
MNHSLFSCVVIALGSEETSSLVKGTVSPDIGIQFSFRKIKLVLSAGPLMVLTFFYFVVSDIFKN